MKIGLSSWAFRWAAGTRDFRPAHPLTHQALLEKASTLGAEVVQICDNMPLDDLDDASLARLSDQAQRRGIVLEVGTTDTRREHMARFVEIAHLTGSHILRVVEDRQQWKPSLDDIVAELRALLPACHKYDVTVAIENHTSIGTRDLARLVQTVGDPHVGICLDTVNSIARLEGWREVVEVLAPYTVSLHLKDAVAVRQGVGFYIAGRPLGKGSVDLHAVMDELRANGRQPNALFEAWMDGAQDGDATLRQEEQWIAVSLVYMRQLIA